MHTENVSELTPKGEPDAKSMSKPTTQAVPIFNRCGTANDQYISTNKTQSGLNGSNENGSEGHGKRGDRGHFAPRVTLSVLFPF